MARYMTPEEHRTYQEYERVLDKDFATPDQINAAWGAYVRASEQADQKIAQEQAETARRMRYVAKIRAALDFEEEKRQASQKLEGIQLQLEATQLQLAHIRQEKEQRTPFVPRHIVEAICLLEDRVADLQRRISMISKVEKP